MPKSVHSFYSAFGLTLQCNFVIKSLTPLDGNVNPIDVRIFLGSSPCGEGKVAEELFYVSDYWSSAGTPQLQIWRAATGTYLRMQYLDGLQFWLHSSGQEVWVLLPHSSSTADAVSYLLGPVLGILLRLRGTVCLHASAIVFGDRVIAFAGGEGAGKSTTAAAFSSRGYRVVTDDIVALKERDGRFHVLPGYRHLCLCPDVVESLYGSPSALPQLVSDWEKRSLAEGMYQTRFETQALPVGAIYVFGDRQPGFFPQIEPLDRRRGLIALVANSFASKVLDKPRRADELGVLGRLVAEVPVRRLCLGQNSRELDRVCDAIGSDLVSVLNPAAERTAHAQL